MTLAERAHALSDEHVVALTIWAEARSEGIEGMVAVGAVIANRVHDSKQRYGIGWRGVCLRKWQFSCWWETGTTNYDRLSGLVESVRSGNEPSVSDYAFAMAISAGIIAAGRAQHYMTTSLYQAAPPSWAKDRAPDATLGAHCFFVGVDG